MIKNYIALFKVLYNDPDGKDVEECGFCFAVFVLLLVAAAFLTPFSIRKPTLSVRRKPKLRESRRRRRRREKKDAQA